MNSLSLSFPWSGVRRRCGRYARCARWMSLSHKSLPVSSGTAARSSRRSSCRALITAARLTRAAASCPSKPTPTTGIRSSRSFSLEPRELPPPLLLPLLDLARTFSARQPPYLATNPDYILPLTLYRVRGRRHVRVWFLYFSRAGSSFCGSRGRRLTPTPRVSRLRVPFALPRANPSSERVVRVPSVSNSRTVCIHFFIFTFTLARFFPCLPPLFF